MDQTIDARPCQDCGKPQTIAWWANHDLWNAVMGSPQGVLCMDCFAIRVRVHFGTPCVFHLAVSSSIEKDYAQGWLEWRTSKGL